MNPEAMMRMERLYMKAAERALSTGYPLRRDLDDLRQMGAFLRAEKREWLERVREAA